MQAGEVPETGDDPVPATADTPSSPIDRDGRAPSDPADRPPAAPRRYRSSLRAEQARRTRTLILDAYAQLVVQHGSLDITMAAVARRANVAERTVYRHFPNATALLDGVAGAASDAMRKHGAHGIDHATIDEAIDGAPALYRAFDAAGAPMKAAIIAGLDANYRSPGQAERIDQIRRALSDDCPHLTDAELDETVTLLRFQLGAWAWYLLTEREGMSTDQAARLSARAAHAIVDALRRR